MLPKAARRLAPTRLVLLSCAFALCCAQARAQQSAPTPTPPPAPAATPMTQTPSPTPQPLQADPADVSSIDGIVAALYDVISGPAGKKRDWARFRSLFAPGARMIPTSPRRPPGTAPDAPLKGDEEYAPRVITPEDYIARSGPFLEGQGFFERETARRTEQFGHIAHVFSTYEARQKSDDARPFMRGINSIQLVNDGKRWWILTVFWEAETERTKLPEKYLK